MKRNSGKTLSLSLGLALAVTATAGSASAFTTGGHFAATERALRRAGFDTDAIRHVQAANYGVDHFVNLKSEIMLAGSPDQRAANVTKYFHSDGLWAPGYVEREMAFLEKGLLAVVADAKAKRDPREVLHALGIASHAIQDFYSHSNVADMDWLAWKGSRVVTFDDLPADIWASPMLTGRWAKPTDVKGLLSGMPSHGGPYGPSSETLYPGHGNSALSCTSEGYKECGVNHDGARRRANLNAILMAAEATYDLAERVKAAVADPALWALVVRPGQDWYANGAWDRAQAMSMAAGQWGFEHSESVTQVLIAFNGSMGPTSPSFFFDIAWQRALFLFWAAAPTAHATGGGADPFPPNAAPLFGLPAPTVAGMPAFIGRYSVLWGGRRAELDLAPSPPHPVGATLLLDGKLYKQERVEMQAGALRFNFRSVIERTYMISGELYPTGPSRDLAGFLRDATGVPDGCVATKSKMPAVTPLVLPSTIAR